METTAENTENQNPAPPAHNAELTATPVNAVAEPVTAAELIKPRGRGRPPGSKTKNRRGPNGKFLPTTSAELPPENAPAPQPAFISQIPGEDNPGASPASPGSNPSPSPALPVAGENYRAIAEMTFGLTTGILAGVFGPEWKPESESEKDQIVLPLEAYLRIKECPDIPPGAILAIAIIGYSAKRLHAPTTKTKIQRAWLWLRSKISRKKFRPSLVPKQEPDNAVYGTYPENVTPGI